MSESFRGLRETLLQMGALALDLPRLTPAASQVALARDKVADRLGLPDVPTAEQQDALYEVFRGWLEQGAREPSAEDWSLSPFVYFRGEPELCTYPQFAAKVAERIAEERLPRILKRAIYVFLRDYDPHDVQVARFGALIERALVTHKGRWAEDWLTRAAPPRQLFRADELPQRLASELLSGDLEPRALFRELGLTTELSAYCGLHQPLALALVHNTGAGFRARSDLDSASVKAVLEFLREGDGLRFPSLRVAIADELLNPFAEAGDPSDAARVLLTEFFDRLYGDPRNVPAAWEGVSELAKAVMLRWVVRKSLELFFDVLSKTADPIWRYRKAFWLALYRHGLIEDAWPAFGRTAQQHLRRNQHIRARLASFGELRGALAQQSVMVMKMRGFTVAEWSHAGACRIWSTNDPRAPMIGEGDYSAQELRQDCLFAQSHTGAMSGSWQLELANWIAQRTGVRISLRELMANTHA